MKTVFAALLISLSVNVAQASMKLVDLVEDYSKNPTKYSEQDVTLSESKKAQLTKISEQETRIWSDTILEGDYIASEEAVVLDSVTGIYEGSKLVAYKIVYSLKSWDTGSCDLDYDALAEDNADLEVLLKECTVGRIIGTSFVSPDLKQAERAWDEAEYFEEK